MSRNYDDHRIQILKDIPICCSNCRTRFLISKDSIDCDEYNENAPMGARIYHIFQADNECPQCNQLVHIVQEVSEYPVGSIEKIYPPRCSGAEILQQPEVGNC